MIQQSFLLLCLATSEKLKTLEFEAISATTIHTKSKPTKNKNRKRKQSKPINLKVRCDPHKLKEVEKIN